MLARANRLVTADEYRAVLRRGRRSASANAVVSRSVRSIDDPARFGFIVTKKVGNAVHRNLVRRRLKAIARGLIDDGFAGVDVVIRAMPSSVQAEWASLHSEISEAVAGGGVR